MKIKLGNSGQFAEIDDSDFDKIGSCNWYLFEDRGCRYARNKANKRMHRVIMDAQPGTMIDHKDGNGLNNKRENLRSATHSQNNANRKSNPNSSSKYLGVSKTKNGFVAICKKNGNIKRKYCKTEAEAAEVYNNMAIECHGQFAKLNTLIV